MPAITTGKVLVTGANGFIAVWLVKDLLEKGFSVRGTVRSESKGEHLKKLFSQYGDKLELVVVDDITKDDAFDEAVKGVDAIQHTASPFHFNVTDPQELINPAVAGTTSVLKSALKTGSSVKRVIVLSSCAAVQTTGLSEPKVFTEADWNEAAIKEVETKGKDTSPIDAYMASKTLAERAAWNWYEKNKSSVSWDLVTLQPPYVFGPIIHECKGLESLNTSAGLWFHMVLNKAAVADAKNLVDGNNWVDVRDISYASVLALLKEDAANNRFIISPGSFVWQEFVAAAHKYVPSLPAGDASIDLSSIRRDIVVDGAKAKKTLGITYRTFEETSKDIIVDFEQKGWWKA